MATRWTGFSQRQLYVIQIGEWYSAFYKQANRNFYVQQYKRMKGYEIEKDYLNDEDGVYGLEDVIEAFSNQITYSRLPLSQWYQLMKLYDKYKEVLKQDNRIDCEHIDREISLKKFIDKYPRMIYTDYSRYTLINKMDLIEQLIQLKESDKCFWTGLLFVDDQQLKFMISMGAFDELAPLIDDLENKKIMSKIIEKINF